MQPKNEECLATGHKRLYFLWDGGLNAVGVWTTTKFALVRIDEGKQQKRFGKILRTGQLSSGRVGFHDISVDIGETEVAVGHALSSSAPLVMPAA